MPACCFSQKREGAFSGAQRVCRCCLLPDPNQPQAAKLQDRTLQQAEELRLALAAAAREVADLQQQAALAAAGAEGPQAAALQAASRDAQRWREGVEARVDAARQQEEGLRREAAQLQQRALASRTCMAQGLQQLLAARMQSRRQSDAAEHEQGCCPPEVPPAAPWEAAGTESAGLTRKAVGLPSVAERPGAWAPQPAQQQQPHPPLSARPPMQLQQLPPAVPAAVLQYANPLAIPYSSDASTPHDTSPRAQAGAAAPPGPPAVPSRTASDILAAYRARQQLRSSGGGAAQAVVSARRSGAGSSQDEAPAGGGAEAEDEAEADAAGASQQQQAPGDAAAGVQDQDSGAAVGGMGAAAATVAEPSTFTVDDDFPSDDSSRF